MTSRLCALALLAAACRPEVRTLAYDPRFGDATKMDVHLPAGDGPLPAVLLIHGGGWIVGEKEDYLVTADKLALSGYVAATINYRLAPGVKWPKPADDCFCALAFLRAHAGELKIDPARIAAMGYSAGGHLVSMLGTASDDATLQTDCPNGATFAPKAIISGAGVHDMHEVPETVNTYALFGGWKADHADAIDDASPILHVKGGEPPYLLIVGTDDWYVGAGQSEQMRDALTAHGDEARLLELQGGGHVLNPGADLSDSAVEISSESPEGWSATMAFLKEKL